MRKYAIPVTLCLAAGVAAPAYGSTPDLSAESLSSLASVGSATIGVGFDALSSSPVKGTLDGPAGTKAGELNERKRVGLRSERIRYTSTNERGELVPVTGALYTTPKAKGLVALAPGTRGLGDQCAPSYGAAMLSTVGSSESEAPTVNINYEAPMVRMLTDAGYSVVVTDYIGLGTSGLHSYLNRVEQGNALIDAARATAEPGQKVAFWGYSQGGGAAAAAAELVADYAPELNVVATFSGAAPADPLAVLEQGTAPMLTAVAGFATASYMDTYPEFNEAMSEYLTPKGKAWLEGLKTSCIIEASATSPTDFSELFTSGKDFAELVRSDDRLRTYLDHNKVGTSPVSAPIMVLTNPDDDLVPSPQATQLAEDYCSISAPVEYRRVVVPGSPTQPFSSTLEKATERSSLPTNRYPGSNHAIPLVLETGHAIDWLNDRFDGKPMKTVCPADAEPYVAWDGLNAVEIAAIVLGVFGALGLAAAPFVMPHLAAYLAPYAEELRRNIPPQLSQYLP